VVTGPARSTRTAGGSSEVSSWMLTRVTLPPAGCVRDHAVCPNRPCSPTAS
jgi:hypothetical protein